MTPRRTAVLVIALLLFAELMISGGNAQQISGPVKADPLMSLTRVKQNAKGTRSVENGQMHFVYGKGSSDLKATSIAADSTVHIISMAAPYGDRFLGLFRKSIDALTVQYRGGDGGIHGAIFTMPVGTDDGESLWERDGKRQGLALGGHLRTTYGLAQEGRAGRT